LRGHSVARLMNLTTPPQVSMATARHVGARFIDALEARRRAEGLRNCCGVSRRSVAPASGPPRRAPRSLILAAYPGWGHQLSRCGRPMPRLANCRSAVVGYVFAARGARLNPQHWIRRSSTVSPSRPGCRRQICRICETRPCSVADDQGDNGRLGGSAPAISRETQQKNSGAGRVETALNCARVVTASGEAERDARRLLPLHAVTDEQCGRASSLTTHGDSQDGRGLIQGNQFGRLHGWRPASVRDRPTPPRSTSASALVRFSIPLPQPSTVRLDDDRRNENTRIIQVTPRRRPWKMSFEPSTV